MKIETSAPGKLFLLGEYAVLEGAPAILTPVSRRARVHIGEGETTTIITDRKARMRTRDALNRTPLLSHIATCITGAGLIRASLADPLKTGSLSLMLDTSGFFCRGMKLGLGSSAAMTAALVQALCEGPDKLMDTAIRCHRAFQGGAGSGADVAACMMNSSIVFAPEGSRRLCLPPSLAMLSIWSGTPASTGQYLKGMARYRQENPRTYDRAILRLADLAALGVSALDASDTEGFTDVVAAYDEALFALNRTTGLNFYTQTHLHIRKQVESAGCIYKPSGAGGGDFGIAYASSGDKLIDLKDTLDKEGRLSFFASTNADRQA